MRQLALSVALAVGVVCGGCSGSSSDRHLTDVISIGPVPCGRNQHAFATVTLPDSGLYAHTELQVDFIQHDPDLAGELSEVVVQFTSAGAPANASSPVPRVRLLNTAGAVFVDTLAVRRGDRPEWDVFKWVKDAPTRTAIYEAFANQALWLELRAPGSSTLGTRVQFDVKSYGINPPAMCL